MTTAIVLAAGVGRRLNQSVPKWLATVGELCPGEVQLTALESLAVAEVVVVVGPYPDEVRTLVDSWRERLNARLVVNEHHASLNNWYTLLLALRSGIADDVLVLNSDLFAAPDWLAEVGARLMASTLGAALAVDQLRPLTDEAMKVSLDERQRVRRIGKVGIDAPQGEYIGMSWWTAQEAAALQVHLEEYLDQPWAEDNWYEHAIDDHLLAGGCYESVPVPSVDWVEIDDPSDLQRANALARKL